MYRTASLVFNLFLNFQQNQLYQKALKDVHAEDNLVTLAARNVKESCQWLSQKNVEHGLSVEFLEAIASARFGITITAQCLQMLIISEDMADCSQQQITVNNKMYLKFQ